MSSTTPTSVVRIGDRMRISVALIRDMAMMPDYQSVVVELTEVQLQADGTKVLILTRVVKPS